MPKMELLLKKIYCNIFLINDKVLNPIAIRKDSCLIILIEKDERAKLYEILIKSLYIKVGRTSPNALNISFLIDLKKILNNLIYLMILICGKNLKNFFSNMIKMHLGEFGHFYNKDEFY